MVWPFGGGTARDAPALLRVHLDERQVLVIPPRRVPLEENPVVELTARDQTLRFVDSHGGAHAYEVASLWDDGARYLHLSVRVGPTHAAQVDALLGESPKSPILAFAKGEASGVRLQPFYLPECSGDPAELAGRGLFFRGLHYPGEVTPGNVSLLCVCDACAGTFRLQSFHAGFANLTYLYCANEPHTLVASSYAEDAPPVRGPAEAASVARFEGSLPPCERCGGAFRYLNPLRCPRCKEPYIDFARFPEERQAEYYGNVVYGETAQQWGEL